MWSKSNEEPLYIKPGIISTDSLEADLLKNAQQVDSPSLLNVGSYYFQKGKYQRALLFYSKAAGLLDLEGMRRLGCLYFLGRGVEKDYALSLNWLMKSAINGHALAQYNVGFLYECGRGVPCDIQAAQLWYQRSASQGCSDAFRAIERLITAKNSLESYEKAGIVYLNDQLHDLKNLVNLLNTKCSYYEKSILQLQKDVKGLGNEIIQLYSETGDTESDY